MSTPCIAVGRRLAIEVFVHRTTGKPLTRHPSFLIMLYYRMLAKEDMRQGMRRTIFIHARGGMHEEVFTKVISLSLSTRNHGRQMRRGIDLNSVRDYSKNKGDSSKHDVNQCGTDR